MFCTSCGKSVPKGAKFCPACGAVQTERSRAGRRANGLGSIYKRGNGYEAQVIVCYKDGIPVKKRKSGFKTKREAQAFCLQARIPKETLSLVFQPQKPARTLDQLYEEWQSSHTQRVSLSTMKTYAAAYKHFEPLRQRDIDSITAKDLQDCMDKVTAGSRTRGNMCVVAHLLWDYAISAAYTAHDITRTLYVGESISKQREPITEDELERIRLAIGTEPYAEYIYALCYLGFRPGEMLALKKTDLHDEDGVMFLVGGSKTAAGKNRRVPVPHQIREIVERQMQTPSEWLFPLEKHNCKGETLGWTQMNELYLRSRVFKPMCKRLGISETKSPYCARHTYADKLKRAAGSDKEKAALIGHADYAFTQRRYQSTDLHELVAVVDSLE